MKKMMLCLAAGIVLTSMPAAAEPITWNGDAAIKYQRDTADGEKTISGSVYTIKLRGEADFGKGWSLFTRFAAQRVADPGLGDFNLAPGAYGEKEKSVAALDQFGVKYQSGNMVYKLGRQDATVGTTALLYSRSDSNIGKDAFVDGLSFSGTAGVLELAGLVAKEDNPSGEDDNKIYALRVGYSPADNFNYGVTLGRYSADDSTNHWAVDSTYTLGKSHFTAEYTESNNNSKNQAYALVCGYDFNDKISAAVTGFRVEDFGSMGEQSDFDAGNRGIHYTVNYQLDKAASLEFVYKDQKTIDDRQDNTSFEATLSYAF